MLRLGLLFFLMHLVWSATLPDNDKNKLSLDPYDEDNDNDCFLDDGTTGLCVPYYLCDGNKTIIEDGSSIINFRLGACPKFLEICCHGSTSDETSGSVQKQLSAHAYRENKSTGPFEDINRHASAECGWNNPDIYVFTKTNKDRIYADYGEFPWMVAIIEKTSEKYLGGGSIIHPSVVLTVAHKVDLLNTTQIKCRGGEWDTQTTVERYPFQERDVQKKILHPDFFKPSLYYDAALLILETPFDLDRPHMGAACLSSFPSTPGENCFTMGWGKDFTKSDKYAVTLKKTKLPIVSSASCEMLLQRTRLGPFFRLHKSLTCAGGEQGVDACQGDGGSPLVCPVKSDGDQVRYAVVGIVAFGIGCGKLDVPGLYVNVSEIYPWINKKMTNEGYGCSTYVF